MSDRTTASGLPLSDETPKYLVLIDEVALDLLLRASPETFKKAIEMHKTHLAKEDCECPYGPSNSTALGLPDGERILIIGQEDDDGVPNYIISVHRRPEWLDEQQAAS